jgi:shikimate dehydrogenase
MFKPRLPIRQRVSESKTQLIDASTRYSAVYGHPVKHSASPAMQNAGLAALGLNWRYLAFDVHPDQLQNAIAGAKAMRFVGLNLTLPHKVLALGLVDHLDASGTKWGAINTIAFEARSPNTAWQPLGLIETENVSEVRSVGYNTDADAIVRSLREDLGLEPRGSSVLLLGAGGAGLVAALRLAEEGVKELYLVNRTTGKAEEIASQIRARFPATTAIIGYSSGTVDLILNATSLGLKASDPLPFDQRLFALTRAGAVYDMVYRPAETPLLRAAQSAGCRTANGLGMLLYQGAKALEIWAGRPAPEPIMRRALEQSVYGQ